MSQDKVADTLNMIMNAKKAGKEVVETFSYSKFLLSILAIAKLRGYIRDYKVDEGILKITIGRVNGCKAIKPRYVVKADKIDKYISRYLPARNLGVIVISTSQGLVTHQTAMEQNLGGSLIAYFY